MLYGKIKRIRTHGRLIFLDIIHGDMEAQIMLNVGPLVKSGTYSQAEIANRVNTMQTGDYYAFTGRPQRAKQGTLSLNVTELPQLLSPSLHTVPDKVTNVGTMARFPQLDLVLNRKRRDLLRLRHVIESTIDHYLSRQDFIRVNTPILAADTGGAVARPFETQANEFSATPLQLRIAPELALKKLVAADLGPVFEIGPNFRNEGLDTTHNPEFSTCEFYLPFADLDTLMTMTEELFSSIQKACEIAVNERLFSLEKFALRGTPFKRLAFLPTLLDQIRLSVSEFHFPRVLDEGSAKELLALFSQLEIPVPANPTVARLLDSLSSHFLEPMCVEPTFITGYPAIMSPLSKSYLDSETGHIVAARAELFIHGTEYCNMYEEENDPFLQARKFFHQSHGEAADRNAYGYPLDAEEIKKRLTPGQQYFVRVLEMGLPPTGGWGGGIERLVMLFGGAKKISDVLPFGNLRSVVAMGTSVAKGGDEKAPVGFAGLVNEAIAKMGVKSPALITNKGERGTEEPLESKIGPMSSDFLSNIVKIHG
ncbi:Adenylyl cyclase-associated protein [Venturia nashicola]|uniref:Adenylyl cyclase-associated protein n=1 Tax=Venturia nashicola TaxID=86259 RepID=A0A4Z1PDR8_9PEZI|nr:Adenylyl cyclase-associated protein [Venturia nashicola]